MNKMAGYFWLPVCVLVVCVAVPLTRRNGSWQTTRENKSMSLAELSNNTTVTPPSKPPMLEKDLELRHKLHKDITQPTHKSHAERHRAHQADFSSEWSLQKNEHSIRLLHKQMGKLYAKYKKDKIILNREIEGVVDELLVDRKQPLQQPRKSFNIPETLERKNGKAAIKSESSTSKFSEKGNNQGALDIKRRKPHLKDPTLSKQNLRREVEQNQEQQQQKDPQENDEIKSSFKASEDEDFDNQTSSVSLSEELSLETMTSCQHVTGYYEPRWLKMVVLCPRHWSNNKTRAQCETWNDLETMSYFEELTFLPVQDEKGVVYANVFCAVCHNVKTISPWTTSFTCDDNAKSQHVPKIDSMKLLSSYLRTPQCTREVNPAMPGAIQECQPHTFHQFMYTRKGTSSSYGADKSTYPVSFNVLLNFDFTGDTHLLFSAGQKVIEEEYIPRCREWETFDPYTDRCRPVTCSRAYKLVGNECVSKGGDSTGVDEDIKDVTQLKDIYQTALVTLQVNITYGDYILARVEDNRKEIAAQIAEHLNISEERIKEVNVTFELGSITGNSLQVTTLTEDEYSRLFPPLEATKHEQEKNESGKDGGEGSIAELREELENELKKNETGVSMTLEEIRILTDKGETVQKVRVDSSPVNETTWRKTSHVFNTTTKGKSKVEKEKGNPIKKSPGKVKARDDGKKQKGSKKSHHVEQVPTTQQSEENTNLEAQVGNLGRDIINTIGESQTKGGGHGHDSHRRLKHGNEASGEKKNTVNETEKQSYFLYQIDSKNDTKGWFVFKPNTGNNHTVVLKAQTLDANPSDVESIQGILKQSMVMKISFVLVNPHDPTSPEEGAQNILQKISNLIVEKEFSLKVNGNKVDVVDAADNRENKETKKQFCPWGVEYMVYDDEFTMLEVDNMTLMYVNKTNSYIGVGHFDFFLMVSGSNTRDETNVTELMRYAFVCFMPRISQKDCKRIDLTRDEFVLESNKSIIFEEKEYDIFAYRVLNESTGNIQICVPKTFHAKAHSLHPRLITIESGCGSEFIMAQKAEGYLTIILGRVSSVALALVLITYLLFPKLRNLPGFNTMNLTLALLVAETIFVEGISVDISWLCSAVAVCLHFFFLSAHFWMNVMSFDVYKTFSNDTILTRIRDKRKYIPRYGLYAWGVPFVIVGVCAFIDFSNLFENTSVGYGGTTVIVNSSDSHVNKTDHQSWSVADGTGNGTKTNGTFKDQRRDDSNQDKIITSCWIKNSLANLLAFGAPILLIFLSNCIFFIRTILNISKTSKLAKKSVTARHSTSSLHKMTGRSDVMLYVRMSTVMGFTWIFGLSSAFVSSFAKPITHTACIVTHVLAILFTIFNTSQGLFIFFAFVCNRRVFGLYCDLFRKIKRFILKHNHHPKPYTITSTLATSSNTLSTLTTSRNTIDEE